MSGNFNTHLHTYPYPCPLLLRGPSCCHTYACCRHNKPLNEIWPGHSYRRFTPAGEGDGALSLHARHDGRPDLWPMGRGCGVGVCQVAKSSVPFNNKDNLHRGGLPIEPETPPRQSYGFSIGELRRLPLSSGLLRGDSLMSATLDRISVRRARR